MADIATLGIAVDSSQVKQAATDLDTLAAAASPTAQRINALAVSHNNLTGSVRTQHAALMGMVSDFALLSPTLGGTAQMLTAVYISNARLFDGFGSLRSAISALLTPIRLLMIGAAAVALSAYEIFTSWKNAALALDDASRIANTTSRAMAGLQAASAFKGIGDSEFFDAMKKFAVDVNDAEHNMGGLAQFMRSIGSQSKGFQDSFDKVADSVMRARTDAQRMALLQAAGLPTTMEWVRFMSQGATVIHQQADAATRLGGTINDEMVKRAREFDETLNKAFQTMKAGLQSIVTWEPPKWMSFLAGAIARGFIPGLGAVSSLNSLLNPPAPTKPAAIGSDANFPLNTTSNVLTPEQRLKQLQDTQQYISLLGELATTEQLVTAKNAALAATFIQTGVGVGSAKAAIDNIVRAQSDMTRVNEQASLGIYNADAAQKAFNESMQVAIDKKLLDPNNMQQMAAATQAQANAMKQLADNAAIAGSAFPNLTRLSLDAGNLNKQFDTLGTSVSSSMGQAFTDMVTGAKSASQAFKSLESAVITAIFNMIAQMLIVAPIAAALRSIFMGFGLPGISMGSVPYGPGHGGTIGPNADIFRGAPRVNGAMGNSVEVNIHEASGTKSTVSKRQEGGKTILDIVSEHVMGEIGKGRADKPLRGNYGARPLLVPR